jgi:hypothetical protein
MERSQPCSVLSLHARQQDADELRHLVERSDEHLVGIARGGHPLTNARVTSERFASPSHTLVLPRDSDASMK